MIRSFVALLGCLLIGVDLRPASAATPETSVTHAVFAQGRLWLISDSGALSSLADGEATRTRVDLPEPAIDICVVGGRPAVVTGTWPGGRAWTVRRLDDTGWTTQATIADEGDLYPVAMVCDATSITIVTWRRLVTLAQGRQTSVLMAGPRRKAVFRAMTATDDAIFIGRYAGEWGGGLQRIDRRTGMRASIESKRPAQYCRKPLDPACDPVNGLATEPWKPACIVAAIGLEHLSPTGRLVEVCGDDATEIYHKPWGSAAPASELPFYDVRRTGETLTAVARDGLYTIDRSGVRQLGPLPAFTDVDGLSVSFAIPGIVVFGRDIGAHPAATDSGPMLVAR